ncbi:MAG TPA: DUF4139 domain-containing protein [Vineibacter sp.]|nr:DUF4139 domain-containing protein [Vineibacter sp.]
MTKSKKASHRRLAAVAGLTAALLTSTSALAQELALKRVMLSSGGVGYFEYEAAVENDATLKLTVNLDQVDDVLKSLVVYDDKGGVGGLSLPGREPLSQVFRDLPFDQSALGSPAALLNALRGAEISVGGSRSATGRVVAVNAEPVISPEGRQIGVRNRVMLMTDKGLQQFVLEEAENLQFADPAVREQVQKALAAIASNRAKDARTVELTSKGQGKRTVRVAYIVTAPVWKASYRLTVPGEGDVTKAHLQGWAVVENMSGQDWKDVDLTLMSGHPVAFRQALYQSYYVDRPYVPVEVVGRLMPRRDEGTIPMPASAASAFCTCSRTAGSANCRFSASSSTNCCSPLSVISVTRLRTPTWRPSGLMIGSAFTATTRPVAVRGPPTVTSAPRSAFSSAAGEPSAPWSNGRSLNTCDSGSRPGRFNPPTPPLSS